MKKLNILACSLMIAGCLNIASDAFAGTPDTMTMVRFGETETLTLKKFDNDGNKRFEILRDGCCIAQPQQDSNLLAFKVFADANTYCGKVRNNLPKSVWHKNVNRYNSDGENPTNTVETYASTDSVLEMGIYNDFVNMAYIRTKNQEVIKAATGYELIGMSPDNVEAIFGAYQTDVECDTPFIVYDFYIDGGSYNSMRMMLEDGVVAEVSLRNDAPGECEQETGERAYYDGELPEGWYTHGKVTSVNLNVRKEPKTGEVIAKIGTEHPEFLYTETHDTGEEYKWVKIITKYDKGQPVEGWVYAKYISPSFKTSNFREGLLNSFEYFAYLPSVLPEANTRNETNTKDSNIILVNRTWTDKGLTIDFLLNKNGGQMTFASCELTNNTYAFAGLRVGNGIDVLNKFNKNADKAGFELEKGCKILDNNTITWVNKENETYDGFNHRIEVVTKSGIISKIKISNLPE